MANARILKVNLPGLLGGVVSGLVAGHAGLDIVGDASADDMLAAIDALHPNVVVLGTDDAGGAAALIVLLQSRHPLLRVVAIDDRGRAATAYEPGVTQRVLDEVSPQMLLQLLSGLDS